MPGEPESYSKCACANCGGHIEFPTGAAGQTIDCPHCAWLTILAAPGSPGEAQAAAASQDYAEKAGEPMRLAQVLVLSSVGALLVIMAALWIIHYRPNVLKPLTGGRFGATESNSGVEKSILAATNHAITRGATTNRDGKITTAQSSPAPPDLWHGLMPGPVKLEKSSDTGLIYAVGKLHNATTRQRFGVKVVLDLFDENGHRIGSATDYIQLIEPGTDWNFKAMVPARTAVRAALASVAEQ